MLGPTEPSVALTAPGVKTGVGPVLLQEQLDTLGPEVAFDPLLNRVKF